MSRGRAVAGGFGGFARVRFDLLYHFRADARAMPPAAATAPHKPHTVSSAHARTGSRPDHARRSHFAREIEKGRETEIRALDPRKASFDESSTMIFLKKKNKSFNFFERQAPS